MIMIDHHPTSSKYWISPTGNKKVLGQMTDQEIEEAISSSRLLGNEYEVKLLETESTRRNDPTELLGEGGNI
tara:strand:- start:1922 stop:2137 length:216 start_codon:yes stop_codon:yes gene_type:complete